MPIDIYIFCIHIHIYMFLAITIKKKISYGFVKRGIEEGLDIRGEYLQGAKGMEQKLISVF